MLKNALLELVIVVHKMAVLGSEQLNLAFTERRNSKQGPEAL